MQHGHNHRDHQERGGADGLAEVIFAVIWFVVSYFPFVLVAIGSGVGLYRYAHLSHVVCGIIGVFTGMATLGAIRAIDRLSSRL
jgi:hypothetical protein